MADKTVSQIIETSKAKWKPTKIPGIDFQALHADPSEKMGTFLYRLAAGTKFSKHRHISGEEILILKGDLVVGDRTLKSGDFLFSPPGSIHEMSTTTGCLYVSITEKAIVIMPEFIENEQAASTDVAIEAGIRTKTPFPIQDPSEIDPSQISTEATPGSMPEE